MELRETERLISPRMPPKDRQCIDAFDRVDRLHALHNPQPRPDQWQDSKGFVSARIPLVRVLVALSRCGTVNAAASDDSPEPLQNRGDTLSVALGDTRSQSEPRVARSSPCIELCRAFAVE